MRICLAFHVVIVVSVASGTDEEAGAHERGGGGAEFFDGRDRVGKRGGVEEDGLVESIGLVRGVPKRVRGVCRRRMERGRGRESVPWLS